MKITCTNCATSYALQDDAIGADGRDVRCARCGTTWFAQTSQDVGIDVDEAIAAIDEGSFDAPSATEEASIDDDWSNLVDQAAAEVDQDAIDDGWGLSAEDLADGGDGDFGIAQDDANGDLVSRPEAPHDIESVAREHPPQLPGQRRRARRAARALASQIVQLRRFAGVAVFAVAVAALSSLVVKRAEVVRLLPDLGGLYQTVGLEVNLRGLEFRDVKTYRVFEDGDVILVIDGRITNVADADKQVPKIRFALRSVQGEELYTWAVDPEKGHLVPGESLRFKSRYTSPPTRARNVQVRFTDTSLGKTASR